MLKRFLPKETGFFDFFEAHNALAVEACENLIKLSANSEELAFVSTKIKEIESKADKVTHQCISALHRTFITPFDRNDILRLIHRLDDILDLIEEATTCMSLYEIREIKPEVHEFSVILHKAVNAIGEILKSLRDIRDPKPIMENCKYVSKLEHDGDFILHSAMVKLFKEEKDPVSLIKWKEILELLEKATDKCHDVTNVIEGIVIEAS